MHFVAEILPTEVITRRFDTCSDRVRYSLHLPVTRAQLVQLSLPYCPNPHGSIVISIPRDILLAGAAKIAFRSVVFRPDRAEKSDPAASSVLANRRASSSDGRGRPRASWTKASGSAPSEVRLLRARISLLSPSRIVCVRPEVSKTVRVPSCPVTVCCSSQSVCGLARIRIERTRDPSSRTASSVCD